MLLYTANTPTGRSNGVPRDMPDTGNMCLYIVASQGRGAACIGWQPVMSAMRLWSAPDRRERQRKTHSHIRRAGGCVMACAGALHEKTPVHSRGSRMVQRLVKLNTGAQRRPS